MSENKIKPEHVVVIGGGITGLSACWYLQSQVEKPLEITLIEASNKLGGKMITKKIVGDKGDFIIDAGPESFVTRKPEAWELALELGLKDQIINPGGETRDMYVLDGGEPKKIPLSPIAFIRSNLLSFKGKGRMLIEPFIRAKKDDEDESLAEFVSRRLGKEALEKMIGPVLAGIYNTDPRTQSVMVTSPIMREMESEYGGLVRGAIGRMKNKKREIKETPAPPQFMTFKDGAQVMVDALETQLSARVFKGVEAKTIRKLGKGYEVELADNEPLFADAIIFTTPGNQTSKMISEVDSGTANLIGKIAHENIGTATLVFNRDQINLPYLINGLMIPRRENRRIDAITWTSNKPMKRAPSGFEMIRIFFGGGDPNMVLLKEEEIVEVILSELKDILGISASPIHSSVFCWPESFPQAFVGHLDLIDQIEKKLIRGLFVAGSSYRGIGIPDCIRQGRDAAKKVINFLE